MDRIRYARLLGAFLISVSVGATRADTIIAAGTTLSVTNTESLGVAPLQLNDGVTLVFPGAAADSAGLNEYTLTNATSGGTPDNTDYGTWTRVTTNVYWAGFSDIALRTEYTYTGRWHIPQTGVYSFYENIDDAAAIAVDGRLLVKDGTWNTGTCMRDVALTAGWHDLEIRIYNGVGSGGICTAATNVLSCGILYSPSNDLISVSNLTNAHPFADPGDGSVLRSARNGHMGQKIWVAGTATFDLAAHDMAFPFLFTGGLLPQTNAASAQTVIAGADEVAFGASGLTVNFPPFNMDVAFSGVAAPQGVTFTDQSTVIAWPTSSPWRIADNATVALANPGLLGAGDVALTNHSVFVLSPAAFSEGATIRVQGTNLTVTMKPCSIDALGYWAGSRATVTNNISLEGVNAAAAFPDNADFYLQGSISGTGTVTKTGGARTEIREPCDFVGAVSCGDNGTLAFDAATAGNSNNAVSIGPSATFVLYPAGYGTSDTTAWIQTLHGSGTGGKIYLPAKQTMIIDTLDGAVSIQGADSTSVLHVNHLATNAVLSAIGNVSVVLDTIGSGASVVLADKTTSLSVMGTDQTLDTLTLGAGLIPVSGTFTVRMLNGTGTLLKTGPEMLHVAFSTGTTCIQIAEGAVRLAVPDSSTVLGDLPALWLDATAANVFTQYQSYVFTNGFEVIERWNDCRPGAPIYGYNGRGDNNYQVYPYVMTNNQNGLSVVSMGSYQQTLSAAYGSRTEARRLPLSTNINAQYVVMMFGGQNGGGAAILGSQESTSFYFNRGGSTSSDYQNPSTPILASSYPVWTNGVSVTATNTGFSGGYQILSINTQGKTVGALGWQNVYFTSGGQNYGEVLVYTNALTAYQRMTAEAYLANKWELPYANAAVPDITVDAGAALTVDGTFAVGSITGKGSVTVDGGASFALSGLFSGTITLNGGTLTVPDLPPPPGSECVPDANRSGWFDPDTTNRVVLGATYTPERPLAVAGLLDRESEGLYLLGTRNSVLLNGDRRPWLAVTNGPWGTPLHWLDYSNIYPSDSSGNTLRTMRSFASTINTDTTTATPTNVQTAFIVLDSSRGGGTPIIDTVYANALIRRDSPFSISSPVWGAATMDILKNGATYLDGNAVDGATHGYNGRPELLSFVASDDFKAAYFGYYGSGEGSSQGPERLGEIILFDTALDDSARASIEAYLMKKWLGKTRPGYSDLTASTITGTGTVLAAVPSQLPAFDAAFSGTVELSGADFDYTLTTNAVGGYVVTPVTSIPGTLSVASAGTISLHFAVKPPAGTYPLITYGATSGAGFTNWTLSTSGTAPGGTSFMNVTGTAVNFVVYPHGTMITIQ